MFLTRFALLCCVVAAVFASDQPGCSSTCCPKNWLGYNGFCYRHFNMKKSWTDAQAYCQGLGLGADLASIHGEEEDHILDGYLAGESAWIGLSDRGTEGTFVWSDGTHYHFNHFVAPQPDDGGGQQDCVRIGWHQSAVQWDDYGCTGLLTFICKI